MDPTTGWAALGGLISLLTALAGYLKYRRGKYEKLRQAEADELRKAIARAESGNEQPLTGLRLEPKD